jgi:hypothetical protein
MNTGTRSNVARRIADYFATCKPVFDLNGNRRFNRARFLKACGVPEDGYPED